MPVTLEQAVKAPILTGRSRYSMEQRLERGQVHDAVPGPGGTTTTSATVSYHEVWFEWCSMWVTKTTGRSASGIRTKSPELLRAP